MLEAIILVVSPLQLEMIRKVQDYVGTLHTDKVRLTNHWNCVLFTGLMLLRLDGVRLSSFSPEEVDQPDAMLLLLCK